MPDVAVMVSRMNIFKATAGASRILPEFVTPSRSSLPALMRASNKQISRILPSTFCRLPSYVQAAQFSTLQEPGSRPFYLDYQATTPVDPRVLDAMLPFYVDMFGNPHSRSHAYGWEAEHFAEQARQNVADLVGALSKEIIFTSGATESNNLAIKGVADFYGGKKHHIITTQIEHKCVLASCRDLQDKHGWEVTYLPVGTDGLIKLDEVRESGAKH